MKVLAAAERAGWTRALAGEARIRSWLQAALDGAGERDAYLLFGTHHDSAGQIDAFRRIVAPPSRFTHLVLEQLQADGRWGGLTAEEQRGDTGVIEAYLRGGGADALSALTLAHAAHDYASWKFGYAPRVMDLIVSARASSTRLLPCDMPGPLKGLVSGEPLGQDLDRVRELHCLLTLQDTLERPAGARGARVAMLWGQAHVHATGLRRFLPASSLVLSVSAVGQRHGRASPTLALSRRLVLDDPVLVELDDAGSELALLLPDEATGGDVDRVRTTLPARSGSPHATVHARAPLGGRLSVGRETTLLKGGEASLVLSPGDHTYAFSSGPLTFVGGLTVTAGELVELWFDPGLRATRLEHHLPP